MMRNHSFLLTFLLSFILQEATCGSDFKCEKDADKNKKSVCIPKFFNSFQLPKDQDNKVGVSLSYIKVIDVYENDFSIFESSWMI